MSIRPLTEYDAPAYLALRVEALEREPYAFTLSPEDERRQTPESTASSLQAGKEGSFVLGAFTDAALVGMVGLGRDPYPKTRHKAAVNGLYVSEKVRGQKIGWALMSDLIVRACACPGLEQLVLWVAATQGSAQALYRSLGFEAFGLEQRALKVGTEYVDVEHLVLWLER